MPLRLPRQHLTGSPRRPRWFARALAVFGLACATVALISLPALAAQSNPPPGSHRAGQGAQPRTPPTAPPVRSSGSVIITDLLQDVAIAGGALIAMLVPIIWYGKLVRRREQEGRTPGRVLASSGDQPAPDPLLEYFGPQPERPAYRPPRSAEPRFQPRPALAGRSTLSPAFAARPAVSAPPSMSGPGYGGPGQGGPGHGGPGHPMPGRPGQTPPGRGASGRGAPDRGVPGRGPSDRGAPSRSFGADPWAASLGAQAGPPQPAAPRPAPARPAGSAAGSSAGSWTGADPGHGRPPEDSGPTLQHAPVAGSPPWEPAPRPTSDLPWGVPPGQEGTGRPLGAPGSPASGGAGMPGYAPGNQHGPAPRSSAPRSIFDAEPEPAPGPPETQGRRQRGESGSRPIYTWNPEGDPA